MSNMAELKKAAVRIANKAVTTKGYRYDPEIIRNQADEIAVQIIDSDMEVTGEIESLCRKNNEDFVKSMDYFSVHQSDAEEYAMAMDYISDIWFNILSNFNIYKSYAFAKKSSKTDTDFIGFVLAMARKRYMSKINPVRITISYEYSPARGSIYSRAFWGKVRDYCRECDVEVSDLYLPRNDELVDEILHKVRNEEEPFSGFDGKGMKRIELIEIACGITKQSLLIQDDSNEEHLIEIPDKDVSLGEMLEAVDTVISYIVKANEMLSMNTLISNDRSSVKNKKGVTYYGYFMVKTISMILNDKRRDEYLKELIKIGWVGKTQEEFGKELYSAAKYIDSSESPTIAGLGRCFDVDMVKNYNNGLRIVYKRLREVMSLKK